MRLEQLLESVSIGFDGHRALDSREELAATVDCDTQRLIHRQKLLARMTTLTTRPGSVFGLASRRLQTLVLNCDSV